MSTRFQSQKVFGEFLYLCHAHTLVYTWLGTSVRCIDPIRISEGAWMSGHYENDSYSQDFFKLFEAFNWMCTAQTFVWELKSFVRFFQNFLIFFQIFFALHLTHADMHKGMIELQWAVSTQLQSQKVFGELLFLCHAHTLVYRCLGTSVSCVDPIQAWEGICWVVTTMSYTCV